MAATADAEQPARPRAWTSRDMSGAYAELEHPADLLLEIRGASLDALLENALYALYSEMVELASLGDERSEILRARASSPEEALRVLLAEALYSYDVEGFAAGAARVEVSHAAAPGGEAAGPEVTAGGEVDIIARLWGSTGGTPLTEVKAVTYHGLSAERGPDGTWRATVLLDV